VKERIIVVNKILIQAIAATAELCGKVYTPVAARMFAEDLDGFNEEAVLKALTRCRKELDGKPFNVAAIIARIEDGHIGSEEAWSMMPFDESQSVVWTDEMCQAWSSALSLIEDGDKIGARMVFKEVYTKSITLARDQKKPAKWTVSLGFDKSQRDSVLAQAAEKGRLSIEHVKSISPNLQISHSGLQILNQVSFKRIIDSKP